MDESEASGAQEVAGFAGSLTAAVAYCACQRRAVARLCAELFACSALPCLGPHTRVGSALLRNHILSGQVVGGRTPLLALSGRGVRLCCVRQARTSQPILQSLTRADSLNLLAVVPPAALRSVTDPAAVLALGCGVNEQDEGAVPAATDLPLSVVSQRLFGANTKANRK